MNAPVDLQDFKLLAALRYEPGYILLVDFMQSQLDNLTAELADPDLSTDQALNKLKYWQAFREILTMLRQEPARYTELIRQEDPEPPGEGTLPENDWLALARLTQLTAHPEGV